jgi:hypothetical protein
MDKKFHYDIKRQDLAKIIKETKLLQGSDDDLNKSFARLSRAFAAGGQEAVPIPFFKYS